MGRLPRLGFSSTPSVAWRTARFPRTRTCAPSTRKMAEEAGASGVASVTGSVSLTQAGRQSKGLERQAEPRRADTAATIKKQRFGVCTPMRLSTFAGITLLVASSSALAQQPLAVPGRSQTAGQQAIDNAACYAYANQTTRVVMAREPQMAPRDQPREQRTFAPPRPVEPPLPPVASGALAASAASASGASGAYAPMPASMAMPASGASASMAAGASMPAASDAVAASGASDAHYAEMKMPPLPPPEPPMTRYWRAYGDCMQGKGYFVR
jgi:hypothetical protein